MSITTAAHAVAVAYDACTTDTTDLTTARRALLDACGWDLDAAAAAEDAARAAL